jgi:DMSO/TMAO reductase YedYZ heme-binding membrane subunit
MHVSETICLANSEVKYAYLFGDKIKICHNESSLGDFVTIKPQGILLVAAIAVLALTVGLLSFPVGDTSLFHQVLLGFALYGYMMLVLAALVLPFLREFVQAFGKPFLKIHHTFAFTGLVLVTLHPALFAYEQMSLAFYVPNVSSWFLFFAYGGSVAFPILYVALAAALIRRKAPRSWRFVHMLVYVALAFGIVHANILGRSFFDNPAITVIYDGLFAAALVGLVVKRYQNYQLKKRIHAKTKPKPA